MAERSSVAAGRSRRPGAASVEFVQQRPVVDTWSSPTTVIAAEGALRRLPTLVAEGSAVVVVDGHVRAAMPAVAAAVAACAPVAVVERVPSLTDLALVSQVRAAMSAAPRATLVAIGGGSVLDVAKAGALVARHPAVAGLVGRGGLVMWPRDDPSPVIAVPTTTGTGSEVSPVAILTHQGRPTMLVSPALRPTTAVLDPRLLVGLVPQQLRAGLVEPFSRAVVPAVAGERLALQDAMAGALARALMELGGRVPASGELPELLAWGTAAALASAQTHTGFLALGRPPAAHVLWPYATEIIAATGATKPAVMAALLPAWVEGLLAGDLSRSFGTTDRLAQVLGGTPKSAAAQVVRWCAQLGLPPVPRFDAGAVVGNVREVWQSSGLFLPDASDDDGRALLDRLE